MLSLQLKLDHSRLLANKANSCHPVRYNTPSHDAEQKHESITMHAVLQPREIVTGVIPVGWLSQAAYGFMSCYTTPTNQKVFLIEWSDQPEPIKSHQTWTCPIRPLFIFRVYAAALSCSVRGETLHCRELRIDQLMNPRPSIMNHSDSLAMETIASRSNLRANSTWKSNLQHRDIPINKLGINSSSVSMHEREPPHPYNYFQLLITILSFPYQSPFLTCLASQAWSLGKTDNIISATWTNHASI